MIAELIRHELAEHSEARRRTRCSPAPSHSSIAPKAAGCATPWPRRNSTYIKEVISSQHVLLEDDQSLEVLLVQGPARRLNTLCDDLRKLRGVQQIKLVTTTALLPPLHSHGSVGAPARRRARAAAER